MAADDNELEEIARPGSLVDGRYRVGPLLGRGGMGIVVEARDEQLGRNVAIKFLRQGRAPSPDAILRFGREARAAAAIRSEHVSRVLDVGHVGGTPFIVMERLQGQDLSATSKQRGPLPIEEVVEYVLQACEALAEAHLLGIVHRDLKPHNLFLSHHADGTPLVKVLDFGIATAASLDALESADAMTTTSTTLGSPRYMSPEQVRSARSVDNRSDVWALGVVLFELLTARALFVAESPPALYVKIVSDPATPLREYLPSAPPALEAIIQRCLEKDVQRRCQNVAELALGLAPFANARARDSIERISRVVGKDGAAPTARAPHESEALASANSASESTSAAPRIIALMATALALVGAAGALLYRFWPEEAATANPSASVPVIVVPAAVAARPSSIAIEAAPSAPASPSPSPKPTPAPTSPPHSAPPGEEGRRRSEAARAAASHNDYHAVKSFLTAKVFTRHGTPEDVALLKEACLALRDDPCLSQLRTLR